MQAKDRHESTAAYPEAVISATDADNRITVAVEPDGTTLTARDPAGTVLWRVDVLKQAGKPSTGFPVVRRIDIAAGGRVTVVVGKQRVVGVDLKTGAVTSVGEN